MTPLSHKPISALETHLGFWMRFVSNHVSIRFQKLMETKGVSVTEWVALRTLFDQPTTSPQMLIEALGMTKGAASKIITRLEEKGLAQRQTGEKSGREQCIVLTAQGQQLVPELATLADENDAHFFGHLPFAEQQALKNALQQLVRHHQLREIPIA